MIWVIDINTMHIFECNTPEGAKSYLKAIEMLGHRSHFIDFEGVL